jgi:predicted RNase H-like HicB family nuclease
MDFSIEVEQEVDGRWLAEVLELPGVLAYEQTAQQARVRVLALALWVLADRLEQD